MPPEIGNIVPNSHRGKAIKIIKTAAITQETNELLPAICALINGLNNHPDPIIPPAETIRMLVVDISRFNMKKTYNQALFSFSQKVANYTSFNESIGAICLKVFYLPLTELFL
ncbi:hypothetical protein lpari_01809 [Legionella parisiensis]|uniref:Uncharacterized protein n=1 Tax=Legionella parisiensis TaxID=45071 RepID=A0A1E5JRN3_9GAMM|nr:hypothetical protein lpari_01809 [Legionella parisiensis]